MNVKSLLDARARRALDAVGAVGAPANVTIATRPEHGDYQVNGVMAAAKALRTQPRDLATRVVDALELDDVASAVEVAGPGFINIELAADFVARHIALDVRLLETTASPRRIVVDYSSPNLAKEMHVGHLRSTIIGDAVARVLDAVGHVVIRQNHVGDWGTQFGMLLAFLDESNESAQLLADLEFFYQAAKKRFDDDPAFAERARARVVALQSGDPQTRAAWRRFNDLSLSHCAAVYDRLGVSLKPSDIRGESAYNADLSDVVAALDRAGLLTTSEGARCVFLEEFRGKDGALVPMIVQKSDGGYLYATSDLAALRYRTQTLHADRLMYFVDARQSLHFRQLFAVARRAGFASDDVALEYHPFGTMLGADGRPFRSREGGVVKLTALLDEGVARARKLVDEKNSDSDLSEDDRRSIAGAVGIGAFKFADLRKNRTTDYVFDWDEILSFDGDTAPYLQYAVTRIKSLFRRGDVAADRLVGAPTLREPSEVALGLSLLRFQESIDDVVDTAMPHLLCGYLLDLAEAYMRFYERCPVLAAAEPMRTSRLILCKRVADTLARGLDLLGIQIVERM
jgi:arginyl-tRNA synthetase